MERSVRLVMPAAWTCLLVVAPVYRLFERRRGRVGSVRFQLSICGEPAGVRRNVGEPAETRREGGLLTSKGQVVVVWENDHYRVDDEASFAREQLQRTFGFAMGFDAVFVPQVEIYKKDFTDLIFADTSLTFFVFVWGLLDFVLSTFSFFRG